ncbi:MAG: hypothetical protein ACFFAJ_10540 [Candidatus Hodarchaeota archaeon]
MKRVRSSRSLDPLFIRCVELIEDFASCTDLSVTSQNLSDLKRDINNFHHGFWRDELILLVSWIEKSFSGLLNQA